MPMKISITYLYTIFRYGYPHGVEDALQSLAEVRKLGFRYFEMEGLGPKLLKDLWARRQQLLETAAENGIHVHNFCVVDPDLVSLDKSRRSRALERFAMGADLAQALGTETLHLASYAPPVRYLSEKPYQLSAKGGYRFANQTRIRLPRGFDWDEVWAALVESCRHCADVAARNGRTVIMEPRVGETVCSVDSLLRLIEHVDRPNFKANFDTGHFAAQRENVVLALAKLRGRFANIHISDNNPVNTEHLPIGDGVIDWEEFFRVLKDMNYDGYLGLDLGMRRSLVKGYARSVQRIQAIAKKLKIPIEV
jgi:sugar phosphate isomerase/epimerase